MVETLVAVAILMIAVAGPLTIAQKGLTAAIYARDQVTASFLAQDAMEYVKNVRDYNLEQGNQWLLFLDQCSSAATQCSVDTMTPVTNSAINIGCTDCSLYRSLNGGYTTNSSAGPKSQFSRTFYVDTTSNSNDPNNEATIVVTVSWSNGTVNNVVTFENQIFNIQR